MPRILFIPAPMLLMVLSLLSLPLFPWSEKQARGTKSVLAGDNQGLEANARMVLGVYCSGCHNQGRAKIDLDSLDLTQVRDRQTWEKVVNVLRAKEMPPPGRKWPQPSQEERQYLITWIEQAILKDAPESDQPARLRSRRLRRNEYLNTIRDLVGIQFQPSSDFPPDDPAWKHTRDLPELSPFLIEKYQAAAEQILDETMATKAPEVLSPPSDDDFEESCEMQYSMPVTNEEQARDTIAHFAYRAFRRPLLKEELENLVATYRRAESEGLGYHGSLKEALMLVLTSPHFLYRMELAQKSDDSPNLLQDRQFELASRLSYFLWNSMPDHELLAQAEQGLLEQNLEEQTRRMLRNPRSGSLAVDFANFWLDLGKLQAASEDAFIRVAHQETQQFVAAIIQGDRSILEFLNADYTFLNERLARHYGIPGIQGEHLRRVSLDGKQRGGLLTQAGILILMSPGGESSPVLRGKWVLENLLGAPPLVPPSGLLQAFNESRKVFQPGTVRQLLEQHRSNPSCAACHAKMDAFGIALENYDGKGAWRSKIDGWRVDATGTLPSGETFTGPDQLKAYLFGKQDLFVRSLSAKLLSFALGRKLEKADLSALETIPQRVAQNQNRFSSVLLEVIRSDPFLDGVRKE